MFNTDDKKIRAIHEASMEILSTNGMKFHHPEIVEIIKDQGIKVAGNVAYFTEDDIAKWVAKAPSVFTLYARNEKYNMEVGGERIHFCPASGASNIGDREGRKRRGSVEDFTKMVKLYHQNPDYNINGGLLIQPAEIEYSAPALMQYLTILLTDKCLVAITGDAEEEKDMLDIVAAAFGGKEAIFEKPRVITIVNTNTPLQYDYKMSETLLQFAAYRQPVVIAAAAMAGTTSPITLAGTIALANAEIIATIAVSQMICPGLPVVYGSQTCSSDLKTGQIAIGSPEGALCYQYAAKLAKAYGIPCRGGGALTDAKILNAQAGNESLLTLMATAGAGTNLIFQSSGIMDGYNFVSFEKMVLDFEIIEMVKRFLRGVDVDANSLAMDAISDVGIAGEFMTAEHTFRNLHKETFVPDLAMRGAVRGDAGEVYFDKISARLDSLLAAYTRPEIDDAAVAAMKAVLARIGYTEDDLDHLLQS